MFFGIPCLPLHGIYLGRISSLNCRQYTSGNMKFRRSLLGLHDGATPFGLTSPSYFLPFIILSISPSVLLNHSKVLFFISVSCKLLFIFLVHCSRAHTYI